MPEDNDKDPTQAFQNRLAKMNGDAMAFATTLFDENYQLRGQLREAKKSLPAEGSVVLSKDDAAEYEALKALGKAADLKKQIEGHATLAEENASLKKRDTLRDVAQVSNFKLSVLEDRDKASGGLEYVLKEEKDKSGEKRKVAYVKHEGKEVPLEQFASEQWADFVPALKAGSDSGQAKRGNGGDPPPAGNVSKLEEIKKRELERQKANQPQGGSLRDRFFGRTTPAQ
jgi:hypothetical protein